jgi:hypothetical protein
MFDLNSSCFVLDFRGFVHWQKKIAVKVNVLFKNIKKTFTFTAIFSAKF